MDKVFSGRLIFVIIITILCLYFIAPTAQYFSFVSGLPETPTAEQEQRKKEMLNDSSMITIGLDLQGGVDLLINVGTDELIQNELEKRADDVRGEFQAENIASEITTDEETGEILITTENYEDVNIAKSIIEYFIGQNLLETSNLSDVDGGTIRMSIPEVEVQRLKADAYDAAYRTIRDRIDSFGLTQPIIVKQPPNRIRVQIPGETDPDRIKDNLLRVANMEFRLVSEDQNTLIDQFIKPGTRNIEGAGSNTGVIKDEYLERVESQAVLGEFTTKLADNIPGVPAGFEIKLGKHRYTDNATGVIKEVDNLVYIVRERAFVSGSDLLRASPFTNLQVLDPNQRHTVTMTFNGEGTESLAETSVDSVGQQFAILLDDVVFSAPAFREAILYGSASISGGFSQQEAIDLSLILRSGSLPAPLMVVSQERVGASLGQESVIASGRAILVGAVVLVILMVFIYRMAGLIAVLAMILNVLLILAILASADATLTLSGIGGILLTMGMAVDANVLIYERLREELESGKPMRAALSAAFSRAFTVILDSNITSLLPALVLILFEIVEGSVKGFWTALAIGLIANVYTAMTVTRALVDSYIAKKGTISVGTFSPFKNAKFNFMAYRKIGYPISAVLIGISAFYLVVHGPNPGIDFTGGLTATIGADTEVVGRADIKAAMDTKFEDVKVVRVLGKPYYQLTVPTVEGKTTEEIQNTVQNTLTTTFGETVTVSSVETVNSVVGDEFKVTAFFTVFVASLIILGYIAMRFKLAFGLGAVAALIHDLLIALGLFVVMGNSLTLDIVSALLIILGYSVNDTIVVFDRIRENMKDNYGKPIGELINLSINQTLTRTVYTSGTTLVTILSMYLFGGVALQDFSLILLIGIIAGTYSSIFVASAVVYTIMTRKEARDGIVATRGPKKKVRISA